MITAAEITDRQRDTIGKLTFDAGHHTVYQHATFEFGLEQVSRQFVWTALHSYPFYNSEQQSQRYVKLGEPKAYVPPLDGEARAVFERAVVDAWESYARLSAILKDDTFAILKRLRNITPKASPDRLKTLEKEAEKKAIETARYVIPLAAFTAMVHTISGITLYRLMRMAQASDTPHEAREVIGAMVDAVRRHDPAFVERVEVVGLDAADVVERGFPVPRAGADAFAERFDRSLDGKVAQLVDWSPNAEEVVADAVRSVFGADGDDLTTDDALDRLLNPARNPYRLDTIQVAYHSPLMRSLQHANYTFRKRLSHTADSQDQRHRMVPGSRPLMTLSDTVRPDYVTPRLIRANPAALAEYEAAMARAWARRTGCSPWACRWSSPSTSCPTPRWSASSSRGRSSPCSTSGRCAPASTRRRRSTRRRWRRWPRSGPCTPAWRASSVRPASSATGWSRPGAPRATSSAASPSGGTSPTPCVRCSGAKPLPCAPRMLGHAPRTASLMSAD